MSTEVTAALEFVRSRIALVTFNHDDDSRRVARFTARADGGAWITVRLSLSIDANHSKCVEQDSIWLREKDAVAVDRMLIRLAESVARRIILCDMMIDGEKVMK